MATPKRKENSLKKSKKIYEAKDIAVPNKRRRVFDENISRLQEVTNGSPHEPPYMSLDVLAQVATDKLRDDLNLEPKVTPKKVSKRSIQCLEILNLEQIQSLSNKALLNFFSEMSCNEMTKIFTSQCYLMPEKCQEKVTSFGHETKAKINMQTHLNSHIEQLTQEANDPDRQYRFIFTAEPIHVRNRKLSIKEAEKTKKKKSSPTNNSTISGSTSRVKNKSFTALKSNKEISRENKAPPPKVIETEKDTQLPKICASRQKTSKMSNTLMKFTPPKKNVSTPRYNKKQTSKESPNCRKKIVAKRSSYTENKTDEDTYDQIKTEFSSEKIKDHDPCQQIKVNFIIDLLNKNQPYHDHSYTTIFGKKISLEATEAFDSDGETNNDEHSDVNVGKRNCPILEIPAKCENGYMVASEEILGINGISTESDDEYEPMEDVKPEISFEQNGNITAVHCGQKPYPPMPKSELAKKGKMNVPEEDEPYSDEAEEIATTKKKKKDVEKCTNELERKVALRCIRELKNRKKDDKIALVCQICCDKTFTASATLMYHYRSHAGIKPFMCVLCHTTFTRQHSLNYHMLIHNNLSRFTCQDCGRKFRHPSHFKEHLRRHTGETPFTCDDCSQKFKTRNTYKRHLKTRHGKLLTANGISLLSNEEFQKVRTKPNKKFNNIKENETSAQLPFTSCFNVTPENIKCQESNMSTAVTTTTTTITTTTPSSVVSTNSTNLTKISTGNSMHGPIEILVKK